MTTVKPLPGELTDAQAGALYKRLMEMRTLVDDYNSLLQTLWADGRAYDTPTIGDQEQDFCMPNCPESDLFYEDCPEAAWAEPPPDRPKLRKVLHQRVLSLWNRSSLLIGRQPSCVVQYGRVPGQGGLIAEFDRPGRAPLRLTETMELYPATEYRSEATWFYRDGDPFDGSPWPLRTAVQDSGKRYPIRLPHEGICTVGIDQAAP